jgi:AcrR family transcriptional regulator
MKAAKSSVRARDRSRRPAGRPRQKRGVRTEAAILDATLRSLAARGVQGTSLDAVAEAVGVAKSSILWHFGPVKEIIDLPTIAERDEATWRFFSETLHQRPELRRLILYLIFESVEGRPELRQRLQQLYRGIRELYESGLRGVVADADQRRRLAMISVATFDGLFLQWLLEPEAVDLDALHRELRDSWERRFT